MKDSLQTKSRKRRYGLARARSLLRSALPRKWRADLMGDIEELYTERRRERGRLRV